MKLVRYGNTGKEKPGLADADGKGCDTFGSVGPWPVTRDDMPNPQKLSIMTLEPGDIITTGTPPGVGMGIKKDGKPAPLYVTKGDVMTLWIEGLGEQRQVVVPFKR